MENSHQPQLEETKRHGSVLFPFTIYPCTIPKDFPSVALHWHKSMEVIFVKTGSMQVQLDTTVRTVCAGAICIVPPGALHGLRAINGQQAEYENIIFEPEFLGSGAADICARQYLIPLAAGRLLQPSYLSPGDAGYAHAAACLMRAEQFSEARTTGFELGVKAAMLELIAQLLVLQPQPPAAEPPGTTRLKLVLQQIQNNYAQPMTVGQVSDICGCSASHFMRWFREMTGSSFVSYLNEYRLAEAAKQLRSTEEKVLTIAQEAGFESLSNFNHQFKLRYGVTPREYRTSQTP